MCSALMLSALEPCSQSPSRTYPSLPCATLPLLSPACIVTLFLLCWKLPTSLPLSFGPSSSCTTIVNTSSCSWAVFIRALPLTQGLSKGVAYLVASSPSLAVFFPCDISVRHLYDDTSMVFFNARRDPSEVLRIFQLFKLASGLGLNCTKSVILPLWSQTSTRHLAYIRSALATFIGFVLSCSSTYLGLLVGASAWQQLWDLAQDNFIKAARTLRGFVLGLLATIRIYNIQVFAKLSDTAQFYPPSPAILAEEAECLRLLFAGPCWSMPKAHKT
jgi:hypothetical protein